MKACRGTGQCIEQLHEQHACFSQCCMQWIEQNSAEQQAGTHTFDSLIDRHGGELQVLAYIPGLHHLVAASRHKRPAV